MKNKRIDVSVQRQEEFATTSRDTKKMKDDLSEARKQL